MTGLTVNDALDLYVEIRSATVTEPEEIKYTLKAPRRLLGGRPAAGLDQQAIDNYVAARLQEGVQPQTAGREMQCLMAALRLAHKKGQLPPVAQLTLPPPGRGRVRILTPQEVERLMREARDPRLRLFITLGLATGARRQAICELTWDRVDLDQRVIDLRAPHPRAHRRKGRAVVPISEQLAQMLVAIRPESGEGSVVRMQGHSVCYHFNKARDAAGLGRDVTPHVLRHTAATMMVRSVPLIFASKMLGHSSTQITEQVYLHLGAEDLRPAAEAASALLPVPVPAAPPPGKLRRLLRRAVVAVRALWPRPPKHKRPRKRTPARKSKPRRPSSGSR